jgi:hypothetical protein
MLKNLKLWTLEGKLDSSGSGSRHSNEPLESIEDGEVLDWRVNYQTVEKFSAARCWLAMNSDI